MAVFQKGQSGNPGGRSKREPLITQALISELKAADGLKLRMIVNALVDKAASGDVPAIREVIDRLEGKAAQPMEHTGKVEIEHSGATEQLARGIAGIAARIGTREPAQTTH